LRLTDAGPLIQLQAWSNTGDPRGLVPFLPCRRCSCSVYEDQDLSQSTGRRTVENHGACDMQMFTSFCFAFHVYPLIAYLARSLRSRGFWVCLHFLSPTDRRSSLDDRGHRSNIPFDHNNLTKIKRTQFRSDLGASAIWQAFSQTPRGISSEASSCRWPPSSCCKLREGPLITRRSH
jgi:hypothetical protein